MLKPDGTFWLAIGDEYAAELKVIFHRELGLSLRSWVIWYYTFGVHCTQEVQPQPCPPVLLREGPQTFHLQRRGDPRPLGPAAGLRRRPGQPRGPPPRRHLDPPPAGRPRRLRRPRATPGTSPASAAPSRSAPAGTAARCPSSSWAGSSAPARTPASPSSTPSAAAARRWPSPRSSDRRFLGFELSPDYAAAIEARLAAAKVGQPLEGGAEPMAGGKGRGSRTKG